jgi:hypothetical protein
VVVPAPQSTVALWCNDGSVVPVTSMAIWAAPAFMQDCAAAGIPARVQVTTRSVGPWTPLSAPPVPAWLLLWQLTIATVASNKARALPILIRVFLSRQRVRGDLERWRIVAAIDEIRTSSSRNHDDERAV